MKRKSIIITFLILIFTMVINLGYSAWLIIKDKQVDPGYDPVGIYNYIEDNQSVIYNGDEQAPYIDEELTSVDGDTDDFSYKYKIKDSDDRFVDGKPTNVGTYTMTISSLTFGVAENITFTITKATPTINSVTPIYNQVSAKDATKYYDGYFTTTMVTSDIDFDYDIKGVKGEQLSGLITYIDTRTTLEIGTVNYSYKFVPDSANYNEVIVNFDEEKAVSIVTYATVNFINGNETVLTIEVAKDSLLTYGTFNLQQNGYELDGWYFNDTKWNFDTDKVVTDMTLIAHWTPIEYTITYDLVGGQLPENVTNKETYTIEETFTINNPEKSGYAFAGWDVEYVGERDHSFTDLDFEYSDQTPNLTINQGTFGDLSFTAIWLAREYDITYVGLENAVFDLNGNPSSINPNPLKIKADETITLINPTGKRGYNFAGWTLKDEDTPTLQMVLSEVRENLTITAHWTPIEYTITYHLDGGSLPEGINNPTTYTVESETFTLNNPVKEGYEFTGWSGWTLEGEANMQVSIPQGTIGNIEFTAHYLIITYNITYELNGGFFDIEYPKTYNYEQSVTLVPPSRYGYEFIGWTGENGNTPEINVSIPVHSTGDKHFIANWEVVTYNISYYDTLEGNALGCVDETYPLTYTIEDELVTIPNATKDGYTFNSWSAYSDIKDQNDLPKFTFNGKDISFAKNSTYGNLVFIAAFDAKPFTITYNLNDNTNVKASFTGSDVVEYYITSTITIPNPIRPGYGFNGWEVINDDPKGPSSFTTNERGELIITNSFGNLTLNAKWIITPYEITFYDGETKLDATETYNVEMTSVSETELYKVQYIPTKTGYIFMGWECDDITVILDQETGLTNILPFMTYGNLKLTAIYNVHETTINYELNGGNYYDNEWNLVDNTNPIKLTYEQTHTLVNPARQGYDFEGWTLNGNIITVLEKLTEDEITLVANWSDSKTYTISYFDSAVDVALGCVDETYPTSYNITETLTIPNASKEGYTFNGWSVTSDEGHNAYKVTSTTSVTINPGEAFGNLTFIANFTINNYKLTFVENGGTPEMEDKELAYNTELVLPTENDITRNGYTFEGWYTDTSLNEAAPTHMPAKDLTLYAKWKEITYNISYYDTIVSEETKITNLEPKQYTIETEQVVIPNPSKDGYKFVSWHITNETTGNTLTHIVDENGSMYSFVANSTYGHLTFVATFEPIGYSITYKLNTGTSNAQATFEVQTTQYIVTSPDIKIAKPIRNGYNFVSWDVEGFANVNGSVISVDEDGNTIIPTGTYGNLVFTATWSEPINYTLSLFNATYDAENDTYTKDSETPVHTITYTIEDTSRRLEELFEVEFIPTKEGYIFNGWYNENLAITVNEEGLYTVLPFLTYGDYDLYARYSVHSTNITYELNGGKYYDNLWNEVEDKNPTSLTYEQTHTLISPAKPGYNFTGWKLNDEIVTVLEKLTADSITLVATYSDAIEYTISYYDGTYDEENPEENKISNIDVTSYTIETSEFVIPNATKEGYEFEKYTIISSEGENAINFTDEDLTDGITIKANEVWGNLVLVASFKVNQYTITFNSNGGSEVAPITADFNTIITAPASPTRNGYTFAGWFENEDLTGEAYVFTTMPAKNFTLHANWTENEYTIKAYDKADYDEESKTYRLIEQYTYKITDTQKETPLTIPNPSKDGYTFAGWVDATNDENKDMELGAELPLVIPTDMYGNIEIYATWNNIMYSIEYDYQDAESVSKAIHSKITEYQIGTVDIKIVNPVRHGYEFLGWDAEYVGEKDHSDTNLDFTYSKENPETTLVIPTGTYGDIKLTALWKVIDYTISIIGVNADDVTFDDTGLNGSFNDATGNYEFKYTVESQDITILAPQRIGYTFASWTISETYANINEELIAPIGETSNYQIPHGTYGDVSLTATWGVNTYTITFDSKGGTDVASITQEFNTPVVEPTAPTKPGYTFAGWYKDENLNGEKYVFTTMPAESFTLYAKWDLNQYTVSIIGVNADDITFNDTGLGGSFNDATGNYEFKYNVVSENITILAPEKVGYTFSSWTISESHANINGNPIVQVDNNKTYVIPTGTYGDITFKAVFGVNTYTITYVVGDGQIDENAPKKYTIEQEVSIPNATNANSEFSGWSVTNSIANGPVFNGKNITIPVGTYGNLTFTASYGSLISVELVSSPAEGNENVYNGSPYTVTTIVKLNNEVIDITSDQYKDKIKINYSYYNTSLGGDPTSNGAVNAGNYRVTASVELSGGYVLEKEPNEATLVVKQATPTINFTAPENPQYEHIIESNVKGSINVTLNGISISETEFEKIEFDTKDLSLSISEYYAANENGEQIKYNGSANSNQIELPIKVNVTHNNPNYEQLSETIVNISINAVSHNGNGTYYSTIERALLLAESGTTVYVIPNLGIDVPIKNTEVTIRSGITLSLPYEGTTLYNRNPGDNKVTVFADQISSNLVTNVVVYSEKIINYGTIAIGGVLGTSSLSMQGFTSGKYAQITLPNETVIENYNTIDCYGFIKDSDNSKINSYNGSKIYAPFVVYDFRGGTNTVTVYKKGNIVPFHDFDMPNIFPELTLKYNAELYGYAGLYAGGSHNTTLAKIIGSSSAIINLTSNDSNSKVVADYNPIGNNAYGGNTSLKIYGNGNIGSLTMEVSGQTIDTSDVLFGVPYRYDIELYDGTFTMGKKIKFLTGSSLIVNSTSTLNISGEMIMYGSFNDTTFAGCMYGNYSSAVFDVYGNVNITGTFGGTITPKAASATLDLSSADNLYITSLEGNSGSTTSGEAMTGPFIGDLSGWEFVVTSTINEYANGPIAYGQRGYSNSNFRKISYESDGNCWLPETAYISFTSNNVDISVSDVQLDLSSSSVITSSILPTLSIDHYDFHGWYVDSNLSTSADGASIHGDITLYAKLSPINYNIVYHLPENAVNSDNKDTWNVEENSHINDPALDGAEFNGWYTEESFTNRVYEFSTNLIVNNTINLYAKFVSDPVITVNYDYPGQLDFRSFVQEEGKNTIINSEFLTIMREDVSKYTEYAVDYERIFIKFVDQNNNEVGDDYIITDSVQITAIWEIKSKVTISYSNLKSITMKIDNNEAISINSEQEYYIKTNSKISVDFTYSSNYEADIIKINDASVDSISNYEIVGDTKIIIQPKKSSSGGGGLPCFTNGTLITMADGSFKAVENIVAGDEVLVFNHYTGKYETSIIMYNIHSEEVWRNQEIINLVFADETIVRIVKEHYFYDLLTNRYELIDINSVDKYISHYFYSDTAKNNKVQLVDYYITNEYVGVYGPMTAYHLNLFANGLLSIAGDNDPFINIFEYDENMKYDEQLMKEDINKYGLFTYDDFKDYISEDIYNAYQGQYLKVAIGKGYTTFDRIVELINKYLVDMGYDDSFKEQ